MVVQHNTNNTTQKDTNKANQTKALNSAQEPKNKGGKKKPFNADQLSELQEISPLNSKITSKATFSELKELVPDVSDQKMQARTLLRNPEQKIVIKVKEDGHTIIVYESGFFVYYEDPKHPTARPVHSCSFICTQDDKGHRVTITESEYVDENKKPWAFPQVLAFFGAQNLADQADKNYENIRELSTDGDYKVTKEFHIPDFADEVCERLDGKLTEEERRKAGMAALASLSQKQREAFTLHYKEGLTYEQISEIIGGDKSSARKLVLRARENLEKSLQKK